MDRDLQFIEARHELHCCENFYQIELDYAECHRSVPALAPLVLFVYCDKRNLNVVAEISALPYIPRPDAAGGAYTKEAEEADHEAEDHFVDREAAILRRSRSRRSLRRSRSSSRTRRLRSRRSRKVVRSRKRRTLPPRNARGQFVKV
ncbi:hypothetical protein KIN20_009815 [Parelaphostrongylus tenuis]|uniref:Uncharacterized protein n=1 Tax=Parelaphostrongylus tenuis TaxID=148309 RepID=A0AAD5MSD4_PARTN|nr:hypothetical protein KIN20_009815 [Parelaphostrongylus tenuis]